jgi:hypothetical protein
MAPIQLEETLEKTIELTKPAAAPVGEFAYKAVLRPYGGLKLISEACYQGGTSIIYWM